MKNKETLEEAAEKYIKKQKYHSLEIDDKIFEAILYGAKWQQEQDNENSWFNEYQEVENYIIKKIGDKFLEATPEKYNTASQATIALLENNWQQQQNKNLYSEEDMRQAHFHGWYHRERLDDIVPEINYPKGLDYEEKEAYAFEQFKKK